MEIEKERKRREQKKKEKKSYQCQIGGLYIDHMCRRIIKRMSR
jgi:hypothetical protein